MNHTSERLLASSEAGLAREKDAAIDAIRGGLAKQGNTDCEDCGDPIPDARRRALPSAKRCMHCQELHEKAGGR